MNKQNSTSILAALILTFSLCNLSYAGEVQILAADLQPSGGKRWSVDVTLKHDDSGWDHYADNWQVLDSDGNVLGDRVLAHPHEDEQPFTRGLTGVKIPAGVKTLFIAARDSVHGWTKNRLRIDLSKAEDGRLRVEAE